MDKDFKALLLQEGFLSPQEIEFLFQKSYDITVATHMIENAIGYFPMPLGLVTNFKVNEKSYTLPIVTEETSVVAALQKTAFWVSKNGFITASTQENNSIIGQLHLPQVKDLKKLTDFIESQKQSLIQSLNEGPCKSMATRGGGVQELEFRVLEQGNPYSICVVHLF
ncbi:MAG TPA: hypothetical protein VI959_02565, partial [Alphaproteobacteria bacterium]|nr:hypothetical protein [Alphaproteobacteria bacterium]